MRTCEECEATFRSEAKFQEHMAVHLLKSALLAQITNTPNLIRVLSYMGNELKQLLINQIMVQKHLSIEEACREYFTYGPIFNKVLDEVKEREKAAGIKDGS